MSKGIIKLHNRYGDNIYLENLEENKWILRGGDYYRIIFDKSPDDIKAVDPSGGPFLAVGSIVTDGKDKKVIKAFEFVKGEGYKVTLDNIKDETDKIQS